MTTKSGIRTPPIALLLGACLAAASVHAEIIFVDAGAQGDDSGESWEHAYTDLQDALGEAVEGDEIRVAAGLYKPVKPADPDNVTQQERQISFELTGDFAIYGGFPPGGGEWEDRDWTTHVTVLSGDIDANDITDEHGLVATPDDIKGSNSYHVVMTDKHDPWIDGFFITAGRAEGSSFFGAWGAGMHLTSAHPLLSNLVFVGNRADFGGGVSAEFSAPELNNVRFINNRAEFLGGGMIVQAIIEGAVLHDVTFIGNSAMNGGGLSVSSIVSGPELTNCAFRGNHADVLGGGMWSLDTNPVLTNVTFSGNDTPGDGGAVYLGDFGEAVFRNSIFWNNRAAAGTGAASASVFFEGPPPEFVHSLVQHCNPGGAWNSDCGDDAGGNLPDADPLFIETPDPAGAPGTAGNLRLRAHSPAVDAGDGDYVGDIELDLDGNDRIFGEQVDLGPYESRYALLETVALGGGTIGIDPAQPRFDFGQEIELTAIADKDRVFTSWLGDIESTQNPLAFDIAGNTFLVALFGPGAHLVTPSAGVGGRLVPEDAQTVEHGESVTFEIIPDGGYALEHFSTTCPGSLAGATFTAGPITSDCDISAAFARDDLPEAIFEDRFEM